MNLESRVRTDDQRIYSPLLFQLSYPEITYIGNKSLNDLYMKYDQEFDPKCFTLKCFIYKWFTLKCFIYKWFTLKCFIYKWFTLKCFIYKWFTLNDLYITVLP
jgi:hypothetical protein